MTTIEAAGDAAGLLRGFPAVERLAFAVAMCAEHDHVAVEHELSVGDDVRVSRVRIDGLAFETEGAAEEVDGGRRVAIAQAGDDGGFDGHDALLGDGGICRLPRAPVLDETNLRLRRVRRRWAMSGR